MKNKTQSKIWSILKINMFAIAILLIANGYNTWKDATNDVDNFLNNIKKSLLLTGSRAIENKEILIDTLSSDPEHLENDVVPIEYDSEKDIFKFSRMSNRGLLLNGVLIGSGYPHDDLLNQNFIFPYLDRIWSRTTPLLLSSEQFYINYQYKYMYATASNYEDHDLDSYNITPDLYTSRAGLDDRVNKQLTKYGFYITYAYQDEIRKKEILSMISPVVVDDFHSSDMGIDIPIDYFHSLNNLPDVMKDYTSVTLLFSGSKHSMEFANEDVSDSYISLSKNFNILDVAYAKLTLSPQYFLHRLIERSPIFILVIFVVSCLYFYIDRYRQKQSILHIQAVTDELTGLYNRRIIEQALKDKPEEDSVTIVLFDADKFKPINDTYGHDVGDLALKHIANTLKNNTRASDLCIRLGGDEFCVIFFKASFEMTKQLAIKLKNKIEETSFTSDGLRVNVSYGYSEKSATEDFDEAFKRADVSLYNNKNEKGKVF